MRTIATGNSDAGITQHIDRPSEGIILSQRLPATVGTTDEWLLATYGRTFHFAARFLSPKHRHLVVILYAFFRTLDDLVDQPDKSRSIEVIRRELDDWKCWFNEGYTIPAPREPLGSRLATVLAAHPVPGVVFLDFLDGLASDLKPHEIRDFSELYRYCYCVAGTVGLAMAHILGVSSTQGLAAAQSLGIGMQLTNILRDVGADAAVGRIYLPQDEIAAFGYDEEKIAAGVVDGAFRRLMAFQIARARGLYRESTPGIARLHPTGQLPVQAAATLYGGILGRIEAIDYHVYTHRAALSTWDKIARLPAIWWQTRALGRA